MNEAASLAAASSAYDAPFGPSLSEAHRSIAVTDVGAGWRRLLSFVGPGFLVAVGYMDPGNWATSLGAGSAYGYALLSVVLASSVAAIFLQALAARLGIAAGRDLAQMCRERFSPRWTIVLWLATELAICATDLAEVIGTAIALNLLFGIPLVVGVVLTALDAFLLLGLQWLGFRALEAMVMALLALIALCFAYTVALAGPDPIELLRGYAPSLAIVTEPGRLLLAAGIIGATVMPHNLYLHSAVVQTRAFTASPQGRRSAARFATVDSTMALAFAFLINSAILILGAAAFHTAGHTEVAEIADAYHLLTPLLGAGLAATAFAVALLACGLNSTVTATLAGQIVMEGFVRIRLAPWKRRLLTRAVAVVPAVLVAGLVGEKGATDLLILSQVVLSLQLPFAVVPLVMFVGDREIMGELAVPGWARAIGWGLAGLILALNLLLLAQVAGGA